MKRRYLLFSLILGLSSTLFVIFSLMATSGEALGAVSPSRADWPAAVAAAPEVGLNKWQLGGFARPGGKIVYAIVYWNDGDVVAEGVIITDTLPVSTTWAGDTSGLTPDIGADGVITWHIGDLPDDGIYGNWGAFAVTLDVDAAMPTGEGVLDENCASISTNTPGDTNPDDNMACSGRVDVENGDVGINIDKWPNPGDPTPGQEFDYTIRWCSDSGVNFGPVWLTDTLPVSTSVVGWSTDWPWNMWTEVITTGGQFVLYAPGLPGDWCHHIYLRLQVDPEASEDTLLSNHIIATTPGDAQPDNNERLNEDATTSNPRLDLNLNKSLNSGVLVPGGWINYFIWYNNQGNMEAPVWVTETVPAGLDFDYAFWGGGQTGENEPLPDPTIVDDQLVWELDDLPVNNSHWFHVQMTITDSLEAGDLITNCATVSVNEGERTPEDNSSCLTVKLNSPGPNLRVTKESWWNGDTQLGYRIHFYNVGDETVSDVWITDTLPTSTTWSNEWNLNFDESRLVSQSLDSEILAWQFSQLDPGDAGNIEFNANLDVAGVPVRWFTNTVEITLPDDDTVPNDNIYEDVAFSGGEVRRAEMWLGTDHSNMWGEGVPGPVTITTAYTQVVVWGDASCNGCWNTDDIGSIWPGDTVIVEAGSRVLPVTIVVPDPFDVTVNSVTDRVWGQIAGAANQQIQVEGYWSDGHQDIWTNAAGEYSTTYPDIPRGGEGHVRYMTTIDHADVMFHRRFQSPDLIFTVNSADDWVESSYESGHTVWLTVTDSISTVKGTAHGTTGPVSWWDGQTGFSTNDNVPWDGQQPDIEVGDWVYGALDNGYTTTVQVGEITGDTDVANNRVTGTVNVPWFTEPLNAQCWIDDIDNSNIEFTVDPDHGTYTCNFSEVWDLTPNESVSMQYQEPDRDWVRATFRSPRPHLRVEKRLESGNLGVGGNAVFYVQYVNFGDADAEDVVITDTLQGMTYITDTSGFAHTGSGDQIVLDLGTVAPGDWLHFHVFAEVTAAESERVTNTVEIATSNPYDQGDEGEKWSEWSDEVQFNSTNLHVDKSAWTGDPVAGSNIVFTVNPCNNGNTASAEVVVTDTLPPSLTLQTWWGQHPGWEEVSHSDHELVVAVPSILGGWCNEVYVRATVDVDAWPGMSISNTATIYSANDLSSDDDEATWWGNVNNPHTNLYINKNWGNGQLVPGGELHYWINVGNNGNIPVGVFRITDTLPVSTTFRASWHQDDYGQQYAFTPTVTGDGYVVWEFTGLENGFSDNFEVALDVDPNALPGMVLINTAEATPLAGEDTYDDNTSTWTETLFDHGPNLRVRKDGQWDDWGENTRRATYWLNVENVGDEIVNTVMVTDTYPAGMQMDGGLGGSFWQWWDWRDNGDYFTMTLEYLEPGWSVGFNFGLITDTEPLPFGLIFINTAEVTLVEDDINPDDNTDIAELTTGPDLWVRKELIDGDLLPGGLITFSLAFGNDRRGNEWWWDTQGDVWLTDTLPIDFEFITATRRSQGWAPYQPDVMNGDQLAWDTGYMPASGEDELLVTVRIPASATGLDTFTNYAEVASSEPVSDTEPYYTNNYATLDLPINLPYFSVSKDYESTAIAGAPVTYTLTVTNSGNSVGTGIILSDTIPAGLDWDSGGTFQLPWVWWTIDSLAADGGVTTEMFQATLPCAGTVVNNEYSVADSDQGVTSAAGAPVSFDVIAPTLIADFDQSTASAIISTTVYFTDTSTTNGPAIAAWAWDFGDGQSASGAMASHAYADEDTFTVTLTITDTCGYSDVYQSTVKAVSEMEYIYLPLVMRNF
jgi:uncharacterized repeat protein (TIGR01451 family)